MHHHIDILHLHPVKCEIIVCSKTNFQTSPIIYGTENIFVAERDICSKVVQVNESWWAVTERLIASVSWIIDARKRNILRMLLLPWWNEIRRPSLIFICGNREGFLPTTLDWVQAASWYQNDVVTCENWVIKRGKLRKDLVVWWYIRAYGTFPYLDISKLLYYLCMPMLCQFLQICMIQ